MKRENDGESEGEGQKNCLLLKSKLLHATRVSPPIHNINELEMTHVAANIWVPTTVFIP